MVLSCKYGKLTASSRSIIKFSLFCFSNVSRDPTEFRFNPEQLEVFDGWRRPDEVLTVEGLKTEGHSQMDIKPTMVWPKRMDLVQDMTSDCSVVASLCAGIARADAGHARARYPTLIYIGIR